MVFKILYTLIKLHGSEFYEEFVMFDSNCGPIFVIFLGGVMLRSHVSFSRTVSLMGKYMEYSLQENVPNATLNKQHL